MGVLYILLLTVGVSVASKVLVVFPVPGASHGVLGESVVKILLEDGHQVTYVSPYAPKFRADNLTYVDIKSALLAMIAGQEKPNPAELARAPHPVTTVHHAGPVFARETLEHPAVRALLRDPEATFDAVLVEWFFTGLLAPLAEVYGCPLVWYRSGEVCWQALRAMHEPSSAAYSRDLQAARAPDQPFTLADRLRQAWLQLYLTGWMYVIMHKIELPAYEAVYRELFRIRGKSLPEYESLVYNASLMLVNSHPPLTQQLALPLNMKYVGGHHMELPPPPVPGNLQRIMDEAANGVIFFSFGSILKGEELPDDMKRSLIEMFARLDQTVVWKLEENLRDLPKNIHIVEWAPQQSILNHSNTVLFITHGGMLSMLEATHFGIPVIGVPMFADQFANVDLAVNRGAGIRVELSDDFPNKLSEAIYRFLENNSSYRANANAASYMFRQRLSSPQQELTHWTRLVIATKGARLLRSPALQVSILERLYLDALCLLILFIWILTKVIKVIKVHFSSNDLEKKND